MNVRTISLGCLLASIVFIARGSVAAEPSSRPNILFIFADDQTYESIHALGNDEIETPNLDKLVRTGTTLTHAYNQGGFHGAVCVASRTMLVSGRYLWHAQQLEATIKQPEETDRLWPRLMKKQGYDTYFTGKWHIKADANQVFDVAQHIRGGMPKQTPEGYNRPIEGQPDKWSPSDPKFGGFWEGGKHWSEVVKDDAIGYLETAAKSNNPFFMYIAFNAPHDPRQSPQEYVDRYPLSKVKVPSNFLPLYPYMDAIGNGKSLRDEALAPFPRTEYAVKVNRQEYYAIITHMDHQIGLILEALKKTGQEGNTYIFFTADHGLSCGHHGLLGKQNMFDHSMRVPLIVVGKGVEAGARIDTPVYLQDIMPTALELAGSSIPEHVKFRSLLPVLSGQRHEQYDAIYGAYREDMQRMITDDGYKLILYPKVPKVLLFDLENDPSEQQDIADVSEQQARIKSMFEKLRSLQVETGDALDLAAAFPMLASQ
ncbi:MAG: sulfatase-like hydrolase/transferase [Planctomycetaceae bacterium]|nr:sulfatase-like hydrolase/transferase [Planctomycetales bacterium]MCB9923109.1 sulfatase-like hydrolase/transferase [Planctomycetaceae bacterium]